MTARYHSRMSRMFPRATRTALGAIAAAAALGACALEPDVGARLAGTCDDTDSNPKTSVSFAGEIRPLTLRVPATGGGGCGCHLPSSTGAGPGTQISGLDLSSVTTLRAGGLNSGSRILVAGQPCSSILYQKLSESPPFGSRMPLNGPPFFNAAELALVHDWIAEGANDN
jgi:hypothetical protein